MKCYKSLHDKYSFKNIQKKSVTIVTINTYQKSSICNDIKYIIKQTMSISEIQYLTPFFFNYKGSIVIITKKKS